ncbi:hypothetical protein [Encephalitozoon cuniculi GB-M1]|uniref:K Homology domain-containing protein n=1 Tax=Encephalitozoon cuniculi (strain GB-M1) TaxID=284813 RepID=Q8SVX9_ENCCU|nr:uncharacterized protein ECU04_0190 [Encephalitozoon cuniculi GB-M1]CAD25207.1 hypothetical protein [Encephalitozoon cuniculi GB-M1]
MDREIPEPDDIRLTSREFLNELRGEYKKEIVREHNRIVFSRDPLKYRKMGLNEYLEKDVESQEEIVVPKTDRGKLANLAQEANVSIKIDGLNRDPNIMILLVRGTLTAMRSFREKMEHMHNKLPEGIHVDGEVKVLDIPSGTEDVVIGRNGTNIYRLQRDFKVIARVTDNGRGSKSLVISGDDRDRVQEACNHVIDMIYKDIN